ncbi:MAG: EAL domain-containing protein [Pseudomonadota bacterium]
MPIVALGLAVVAAAIWGAWMLTTPMAELERSSGRLIHMTDQARQIQIRAAGLMTELRGAGSRRASADISAETSDALRSAISDLQAREQNLVQSLPADMSPIAFQKILDATGALRSLAQRVLDGAVPGSDVFASTKELVDRIAIQTDLALAEIETAAAAQFQAQSRVQDQIIHVSVAAVGIIGTLGLLFVLQHMATLRRMLERLPDRFSDVTEGVAETMSDDATPIASLNKRFNVLALNIRERLLENEKIERMAFTDSLTGLPNRRGLLAFLDLLANKDHVWEDDGKIGLIHIDLDHFKAVNDTLGHDAGDFVLREATRRMSTAIRDSDLLARLGGDEFLIVATGIEYEADMTRIAERLITQFEAPITYGDRICRVGVSMGMVLGGQRGRVRDPKRLLINADTALFRAKSLGRGRFAIFNSDMAEEARRRNERAIALGNAIHSESFFPWFQPIVDCRTGETIGLELLARWHDAERGIVMPQDFMQDAEANSLMEDVGLQVLHRALEAIRNWHRASMPVPVLHLNLSRTQLLSGSFVDRLSWMLDDNNIAPERVAAEISEADCAFRGSDVAISNLGRLAHLGVGVVLDDFGARDGALRNISRVGAGTIKFNVPDLSNVAVGRREALMTVDVMSSLQRGASSAGLMVCAKGVESAATSTLLSDAGVWVQQGDYHAPVLNLADTRDWLHHQALSDVSAMPNTA